MRELSHSLHAFIEALHHDLPIHLTAYGKWRQGGSVSKWVNRFLWREQGDRTAIIQAFNQILDDLELIPINFSKTPGVVASQQADFHSYLSAAQSLRRYASGDKSQHAELLLQSLRIKVLGLLYRLEEENGGLQRGESEPDSACLKSLVAAAEKWKKEEQIFWKTGLREGELSQLALAAGYHDFVKMVLEDKGLRDDFFLWTLRDGLPVDVYIQFPALQKKLTMNNMRGRISRMGQDFLKMRKADRPDLSSYQQKLVTLPFEGVELSLLDENREIVFRGNYKVKLTEIYRVFRDKSRDLGNFEMFAEGILNWNSKCIGWWNHDLRAYELVDLEPSDWWRQLPVLEVLTSEAAAKRLGVKLDGHKWALAAKAARESCSLDYERSHAYVEMAIPAPDNRYYIIYTFGKAVMQLPHTSWDRLILFGTHVLATVVYPDETMYFTHRQQIGYTFELTPSEGMRIMDAFKGDIQLARKGNMVFQLEAENCGKWLQTHLEEHLGPERVPNLYRFPLLEAEPTGMMSKFFGFFQSLPQFCRNRLFILIHYPLGAWRGRWVIDKQGQKVWKSLLNSPFWKDAITYLPAYLHKQHETGVFAEDPERHKVWIEGVVGAQKKEEEEGPLPRTTKLFEENI